MSDRVDKAQPRRWRNRQGRFTYSGDMARLCRCGHMLGVHTAGGYDCQAGTFAGDTCKPCTCPKFKLKKQEK